MLVPVTVRFNIVVATTETFVLEDLTQGNLPLLFPELSVFNRTTATSAMTVAVTRQTAWVDQANPDFNGVATQTIIPTLSIAQSASAILPLNTDSLGTADTGIATTVSVHNAGPVAAILCSVVLRGMIETAITPDPSVIING